MTAPTISVILRTLNRSHRLPQALQSLADQTLRNFEVVIVDMSANSTTAIVESFRERIPSIRHIKVGGPLRRGKALNLGIKEAAAAQIAILDDDNLYYLGHLQSLVEGLEQSGSDLAYSGIRQVTYTKSDEAISNADR